MASPLEISLFLCAQMAVLSNSFSICIVLRIHNFGHSRILDRRNRGRKVAPVDQGTRPTEAAFMWLSQSVLHSFLMAFFRLEELRRGQDSIRMIDKF